MSNNIMQWFGTTSKGNPSTPGMESLPPPQGAERAPPPRKGPHTQEKSPSQPREAAQGPTPPVPKPGQRLSTGRQGTPPINEWANKTASVPKPPANEPAATASVQKLSPSTSGYALTPSDITMLSDKCRKGQIVTGSTDIVARHLAAIYGASPPEIAATQAKYAGATFDRAEPVSGKLQDPPSHWLVSSSGATERLNQ